MLAMLLGVLEITLGEGKFVLGLFLSIFLCASLVLSVRADVKTWGKVYGGAGWDVARSVVEASDGGYVVAGYTDSFGAGGYDFWLVKVDEDGGVEWNMLYGGAGDDVVFSLVATSDGGYALAGTWEFADFIILGSYGGDPVKSGHFWLVKTDASGNMEWNQTYGGGLIDCAYSVVNASDGGYAIAGITTSFGAGGADFLVIKTDENGVAPPIPEAAWVVLPLLATATIAILISKKKLVKRCSAETCGGEGVVR